MFSLIVTLISIALVAALALATLYYGGPVFNQGAARAHAAKIAAQGQQIQGAAELYKADTGEYPISLAELVTKDYLKSIPVAAAQEQVLINNALAASSWVMVAPKTPVFALTGVTEAVCKAVNLGSYGVEGILKTARESNRVQCYGTSTGSLMIVQAKAPSDLVAASTNPAAVIQVGTVLTAPVPAADSTDTSNAGWLVPPGAATPAPKGIASPSASTLTFSGTAVGSTSASQVLTITNTGNAPLTLAPVAVTVTLPFALDSTTCHSATLQPAQSCTASVTFTPTALGVVTGASYALQIYDTKGQAGSVALTGSAALPAVTAASCLQMTGSSNMQFAASEFDSEIQEANSSLVNTCARPVQAYAVESYWNPAVWFGGWSRGATYVPGEVEGPAHPSLEFQIAGGLLSNQMDDGDDGTTYPGAYEVVPAQDFIGLTQVAWYLEGTIPFVLPAPVATNNLTLSLFSYKGTQDTLALSRMDATATSSTAIPMKATLSRSAAGGCYYGCDLSGRVELFVRFADEPGAPFVKTIINYTANRPVYY